MSLARLLIAACLPAALARADLARRDVAVSTPATCAINDQGKLYCWGSGASGIVVPGANEPDTAHTRPVPINAIDSALAVKLSDTLACAVKDDLSLVCWGELYEQGAYEPPHNVFPGSQVEDFDVANYGACIRSADNNLICVGTNTNHRFSTVESTSHVFDTPHGILNKGQARRHVGLMNYLVCASYWDGDSNEGLWCRGDAEDQGDALAEVDAKLFSCSSNHCCYSEYGNREEVTCTGYAGSKSLGVVDSDDKVATKEFSATVYDIITGNGFTIVTLYGPKVYAAGDAAHDQFGSKSSWDFTNSITPEGGRYYSTGYGVVCRVSGEGADTGRLSCRGRNTHGNLGRGFTSSENEGDYDVFVDIGGVTRTFAQPTMNPTRAPVAYIPPSAPTAPTFPSPTVGPTAGPTARPTFRETARPTNAVLQLTPTQATEATDDTSMVEIFLALAVLGLLAIGAAFVALR